MLEANEPQQLYLYRYNQETNESHPYVLTVQGTKLLDEPEYYADKLNKEGIRMLLPLTSTDPKAFSEAVQIYDRIHIQAYEVYADTQYYLLNFTVYRSRGGSTYLPVQSKLFKANSLKEIKAKLRSMVEYSPVTLYGSLTSFLAEDLEIGKALKMFDLDTLGEANE